MHRALPCAAPRSEEAECRIVPRYSGMIREVVHLGNDCPGYFARSGRAHPPPARSPD